MLTQTISRHELRLSGKRSVNGIVALAYLINSSEAKCGKQSGEAIVANRRRGAETAMSSASMT